MQRGYAHLLVLGTEEEDLLHDGQRWELRISILSLEIFGAMDNILGYEISAQMERIRGQSARGELP